MPVKIVGLQNIPRPRQMVGGSADQMLGLTGVTLLTALVVKIRRMVPG